jgi:hypothetical protein
MSIFSPSYVARSAWENRLAANFNSTYASVAALYPGAPALVIDFTSPNSFSFFRGRVTPEEIETTGVFKFPLMCSYATAGKNTNWQKFMTFTGDVRVCTDVHLSYTAARLPNATEPWADAVEHTLVYMVNTANSQNQNWGPGLTYDGQVSYERMPVRKGGPNFLQTVRFGFQFQVNI